MSWFQTGLSTLTGQIGNFTREVLTEGTEEVEDVATQFKVARTKLNETELLCSSQKKELDQLKKFNDELRVQMESKELQIQSITENFKEILATKDEELIIMKEREMELLEASHTIRKDSFSEASDDTEDVLLLQHKIANQQDKIHALESELKKFQQKDSQHIFHGISHHDSNSEDRIMFLENKIKSLDKELSGQLDRHQHEFASLQDSHSCNLTSLKRNQANIVEQLKEKIQQLEEELKKRDRLSFTEDTNGNITSHSTSPSVAIDNTEKHALLEKLDHLERKNAKLEFDSAQVHAVDRKKTKMIESLQLELDTCKADVSVLSEKLKKEIVSREELYKEFQLLMEENQALMDQLNVIKLHNKSEKNELKKKLREVEERLELVPKKSNETEDSLDDFESKIIQLKKGLMDAENARIVESEISAEKIRVLEDKLITSEKDFKMSEEVSKRSLDELEAKNSDLEAEKTIMKRKLSELEDEVKNLAENLAECQKLKENTEAVLAMERRDRECGAIIDRDLLKQKNLELERELEKITIEYYLKEKSYGDIDSELNQLKKELATLEIESSRKFDEMELNYEAEIEVLKDEIESLKKSLTSDKNFDIILEENKRSKLADLETECCNTEHPKTNKAKTTDSGQSKLIKENEDEDIENLKKEVERLKQEHEQAESVSILYETEIERLSTMEKDFEDLKQKHKELKQEKTIPTNSSLIITRSDTNSSIGSDKSVISNSSKTEISTLKSTISKHEELIKTLNGKYSSVFKLLEDKSIEHFGNEKILVRLNQLQTELELMQKEREHMISILNDKTREASSLKSEVHLLMDTVSAGKLALTKLQSENNGASSPTGDSHKSISSHGSTGEMDGEEDDMKKEAIKKLSRMIKDKDVEIDALNKKNETLLQVLQTQSSESLNHEIKRLLFERDNLQQQVSSFQLERDQLINALNAKHSESVGYFDELKKQREVVQETSVEMERLKLSHRSMTQQLDEKQSNLIKLLDEHSNMRRKLERRRIETDDDDKPNYDDENRVNENDVKCSFTIGAYGGEGGDDDDVIEKEDGGSGEASTNKLESERMNKKSEGTGNCPPYNKNYHNRMASRMVEKMMREKESIILEREKSIAELQSKVLYFESEAARLQSMLASMENHVKEKDSDISTSKKRIESLSFKLHGEVNKRSEVEKDFEDIQMKIKTITSELSALKKSNTTLASNVTQKDLELNSLRHELETYHKTSKSSNPLTSHANLSMTDHQDAKVESSPDATPVVTHIEDFQTETTKAKSSLSDEVKVSNLDNINFQDKVLTLEKIIEELQKREEEFVRAMIHLQKEREQLYLVVHYHQNESIEAKNMFSNLQDREKRLAKECDRLRDHLVKIEEGYNKEALDAEEREKNLRNQLTSAQEKIASLTDSVLSNRSNLTKQTENLQQQLHSTSEQRDDALLQLSAAQETISSYSCSLSNLQMVLEQFQSERTNQQSLEVEKFQVAFNKKQLECQQLQNQVQNLLVQMEDHSEAIKAAQRLSEQMDRKEHLISALKEEVRLREIELKKTCDEIRKLTSSTEAKVDKVLMKSLLIGYFHAPISKRLEAFKVIGHILNFSSEELNTIGMSGQSSSGWIEGIFGKKSSSSKCQELNKQLNKSFSELFVSFLERESTLQQSDASLLRFPAEKMIAEQQNKKQNDPIDNKMRNSPAFNPFSVPISAHPITPLAHPITPLAHPITPLAQPPAPLGAHGSAGSSLLAGPHSNVLSSQIPPSTAYYPSIVPTSIQGSREKSKPNRDSIVPIVLAAAAASPINPVYINNSNVNYKNINK